jgi:hypothetical protein
MEPRVARLEADVGHIQKDVTDIKVDLKSVGKDVSDLKVNQATLTERVSHLPTVGQSFAMLSGMLVLIAALVVFQGQIQKFAGVSAPASTVAPAPKS